MLLFFHSCIFWAGNPIQSWVDAFQPHDMTIPLARTKDLVWSDVLTQLPQKYQESGQHRQGQKGLEYVAVMTYDMTLNDP